MENYADWSDEELMAAWQRGDSQAGQELVTRYHAPIHRFFRYKFEPDVAKDLVQATFLGLSKARETFRGDAKVRTFLFRIARNQCNLYLRNLMRDRGRFDPQKTSLKDSGTSPSGVVARKAEKRLLLTALREQPIDTQIMFELHYWEEMKLVEIADILNMNENTVRGKMRRAKIAINKRVEELAESQELLASTQSRISAWAAKVRDNSQYPDVSA